LHKLPDEDIALVRAVSACQVRTRKKMGTRIKDILRCWLHREACRRSQRSH
jgi:hypothetical protein